MIRHSRVQWSRVSGVRCVEMKMVHDRRRGDLTVGGFGEEVPFSPARYFITHSIPNAQTRGEHAHRVCEQLLVCVHGACTVLVDDGCQRQCFRLDHPSRALYIPPMIWAAEYDHSTDSALLVFASHAYDPDDYIRDYNEFRRLALLL